MSIQTEIDRIITAVGAAYDAVEEKGGTLPTSETVANLAEAISSIPKPETWIINEVPNFPSSDVHQKIPFMTIATSQVTGGSLSYNYPYTIFHIYSVGRIHFQTNNGINSPAYMQKWEDPRYRRVSFLTPPSGDLLAWLTDNAVKITDGESYSYNVQESLDYTVNGSSKRTVAPTPPYDSLRKVIVKTNIVEQATPSIYVHPVTGEITSTVTQTEAGWVKEGTKFTTQQLDTQAAKTVTPSAAQQTAVASGKYTTGDVVVAAVPTEEKTVELSMTSGDQTVIPSSGKFLSAVTVKKPATMLPENIKKGVSIGGVVGTLEEANLQDEKSVSVTANGTVEVTPDEGYDGVKKVSVAVNVPSSGGEIGATADASVMGLASGTAKVIFEMPDGVIGGVGLTPNASVNFETKVGSVVVVVASDAMYIDGDSSNGIEVLPTNYNNQPFAAGESGYIAAAKVTEDAPTIVLG